MLPADIIRYITNFYEADIIVPKNIIIIYDNIFSIAILNKHFFNSLNIQ